MRSGNSSQLLKVAGLVKVIKLHLTQFTIKPSQKTQILLNSNVTELLEALSVLDLALFDHLDYDELDNLLHLIPFEIHGKIVELIALRKDVYQFLPLLGIMRDDMLPANQLIFANIEEMVAEADNSSENSSSLKLIEDLKITWVQLISEFRLMASTHYGLFETGLSSDLKVRQQNMDILETHIIDILNQLQIMYEKGQLEFLAEQYLPNIVSNTSNWIRAKDNVIEILLEGNWRKDLKLLEQINADLNSILSHIETLIKDLELQSSSDILTLSNFTQQLFQYVTALTVIFIALIFLGYIIFDRTLLKPIALTTKAMLSEAQGKVVPLPALNHVRESRNLLEAFNSMSNQIKIRESRLNFIAHHDVLTRLPNRLLFNDRLEHALSVSKRIEKPVVLMFLDLDRFKQVNDTLGHLVGDKLLIEVSTRLCQCLRARDTIARLGGDEFAIIFEDTQNDDEIIILANKIVDSFVQPFIINDHQIHSSTSIGIAIAPRHTKDKTELVRYADIAMYQSKKLGRNQFCFYDSDQFDTDNSIITFENSIRNAILNNEFELYFQPIINLQKDDHIACEALIRWHHPEQGLLRPKLFIAPLEHTGLMSDITHWVIEESIEFQLNAEKELGIKPQVSINISPEILQQEKFRLLLSSQLLDIKNAENITLEVSEDSLISDIFETNNILNKLKNHGYNIALDDFGTGQSSLSHLRTFPIDVIKIDQEFIRNVNKNENDTNLVCAIISLAYAMDKMVVAEGVENQRQLDFLKFNGCNHIQGYYMSRPVNQAGVIQFFQKQLSTRQSAAS